MAYVSETTNGLTKWWIVGTGGTVNRLSELMDDQADGPYLDTADVGAWTNTVGSEWKMTLTTQPDGTTAAQDVYDTANTAWLTANHGNEGSLASGEWSWAAGTTEITVRLGDDSDPNSSDPYAYYAWSNFMTEHVEDAIYQIHQYLEIGDGSTATTLTSLNETVRFDDGKIFNLLANATLTLGELSNGWGINGSYWRIHLPATDSTGVALSTSAVFNVYGSIFKIEASGNYYWGIRGPLTAYNSIFEGGGSNQWLVKPVNDVTAAPTLKDVQIKNFTSVCPYHRGTLNDLRVHGNNRFWFNFVTVIIEDALVTDMGVDIVGATSDSPNLIFRNPKATIESITKTIQTAYQVIAEEYPVDLTIVDKDGNAISGATVTITDDQGLNVTCEEMSSLLAEEILYDETAIDVDDGTEFAADDVIKLVHEYIEVDSVATNTLTVTRQHYGASYYPTGEFYTDTPIYKVAPNGLTTDVNGQIERQWLPYKFWHGTSETEFNPNPYTITISKAGYETLIFENITIDSPVDWRLELQDSHPVVGELLFDTNAKPHLLIAEQIITDVG